MEQTQAVKPKVPSEVVDLYNLFIHGEISRRDFLDGVSKFAVGGLTAATLIEALMPNYAQAQQVAKNDDRIKASYETVDSPKGNGKHQRISGAAGQRRHAQTKSLRSCPASLWCTRIAA